MISKDNKLRLLIFFFLLFYYFALSGPHLALDSRPQFLLIEDAALNSSFKTRLDLPSVDEIQAREYVLKQSERLHELQGKPFDPSNPAPIERVASPVLLASIGVPFYHLANFLSLPPTKFVPFILNPIITALAGVVIFSFGQQLYDSRKIGIVLAIFFGVTSLVVPWTSELYTRLLASLLLISAIYFSYLAKQKSQAWFAFLGGLFNASMFLAQPMTFPLILPIAGYSLFSFRKNKKLFIAFLLGFFIGAGLQGYLNLVRFGSPLSFGFNYGEPEVWDWAFFKNFEGLYGLFISPSWSFFVYYPIAILFPLSFYLLYKKDRSLSLLFTILMIVIWFYVGIQTHWTGYGSWGPRYLIPMIPVITIATGAVIQKFSHKKTWKGILASLAALGFFVNLLGSLIWFMVGYGVFWEDRSKGLANEGDLNWHPMHSLVVNHFKAATTGFAAKYQGEFPYGAWQNYTYSPCSFDLLLYCNYGLVPIFILAAGMAVISYFIIKILMNEKRKLQMSK